MNEKQWCINHYMVMLRFTRLFVIATWISSHAFLPPIPANPRHRRSSKPHSEWSKIVSSISHNSYANKKFSSTLLASQFAVPISELELNLTSFERSVTGVVRRASPSVAYVTSVWPQKNSIETFVSRQRDYSDEPSSSRRSRDSDGSSSSLPPGRSLGSGSGFLVEYDGYIVTNYHVIERAYTLQSMQKESQQQWNSIRNNISCTSTRSLAEVVQNNLRDWILPPPKVFCRINSASKYESCRIVDVQPDLDVAVLKIENSTNSAPWPSVPFGSSSDLLVGQSLVAIGNPFGLDQSVSSGVVSALDREIVTSSSGRGRRSGTTSIRGCIQTDAAINPGNSGGPLLNLAGQVVGVNTAIVTTSGSNAGIGFAIPSDKVHPIVQKIIETDRRQNSRRARKQGYLGIGIIPASLNRPGVWIGTIDPLSPAGRADLQGLTILESGRIEYGDSIVAVGGNSVSNYDELRKQLQGRVPGEKLTLTIENGDTGARRVVYLELEVFPNDI
jgi:S1-C subfamily serine protease